MPHMLVRCGGEKEVSTGKAEGEGGTKGNKSIKFTILNLSRSIVKEGKKLLKDNSDNYCRKRNEGDKGELKKKTTTKKQ